MALFSNQNDTEKKLRQKYQQLLEKQESESLPQATSAEPVVGLRVWHVFDDSGLPKLRSVVKPVVWPYRKALERDPILALGIHALRLGGDAIMALFREYSAHVAGEVYLWGGVTEHERGYLADCAYPKRLFVPEDFCPIKAMQLEDEYGVPCEYRVEFVRVPQQQAYLGAPTPPFTVVTTQMQQAQAFYQQYLAQGQANVPTTYPQALYGLGQSPWKLFP